MSRRMLAGPWSAGTALRRASLCVPLALGSCVTPDYGPKYVDFPEASDACLMQLDVPAVLDGAWAYTLFECINERSGYFDELDALAFYATHNPNAVDYLFTPKSAEEPPAEPDPEPVEEASGGGMAELLEYVADLLSDPSDPSQQIAEFYVALHDDYPDILIVSIGILQAVTDEISTCEEGWDAGEPESQRCHTLRLVRKMLDRHDLIDAAERVLVAVSAAMPEPESTEDVEFRESMRSIARLLQRASARPDNPLMALARTAIGETDEDSQLLAVMSLVRRILFLEDESGALRLDMLSGEDGFVDHFAKMWRDGNLQLAPAELDWLFTHDVNGEEVPLGSDDTVIGTLLGSLGDFTMESELDPTLMDTGVDIVGNLYLNDGQLDSLVGSLSDAVGIICDDSLVPLPETLAPVCDIADAVFPPLTAMTVHAPNLLRVGLGAVYVYSQFQRSVDEADPNVTHLDIDALLEVMTLLEEWEELQAGLDILDSGEPSEVSLGESLEPIFDLVPVFVNTRLGRLTPVGEDAFEVLHFAVEPWTFDEDSSAKLENPLMVVAPLLRRVLFAEELGYPKVDIDRLMDVTSQALLNEGPMEIDRIADLLDVFVAAGPEVVVTRVTEQVDTLAEVAALIDDDAMWAPLAQIAGDPELADLIVPHPYPQQDVWQADAQFWIKQRLDTGLMTRVLHWTSDLLSLVGIGTEDEDA